MRESAEKLRDAISRRDFVSAMTLAGALAFGGSETIPAMNDEQNRIDNTSSIDFLGNYSTTLLESALSLIKGTHDGIKLTRPGFLRRTAASRRLVGYAVTSVFSADPDDSRGRQDNLDYWKYAFEQPGPKIAISVDAGQEPASGSSWGQLNGHIHKALGCRGVLTNGGVRDIGEFDKLGFEVYSGALTVGHGNPHFVDFGKAVSLYGTTFKSADVVCVDEHGAIVVPPDALPHIEEAAEEVRRRVAGVAEYCRRADFSPAGLQQAAARMKPANPWRPSGK